MILRDYCLRVLIEENPWAHCKDIRSRGIIYEDVANNISFDILDAINTTKERPDIAAIVKYWLHQEFGAEDIHPTLLSRCQARISGMVISDEVKESFFNG